jgi:hypothetical protein
MGKKIVIFSGIQKPTDKLLKDDIKGTGQLYSYYLRKEFEKMGIETVPCPGPSAGYSPEHYKKLIPRIPSGDHIISVEQRGFYNRRHVKFLIPEMRKKISGKITTICDNNTVIGPEDMLYYAVPAKSKPKSKYVGWAADPSVCRPNKRNDTLRILIDHSYYKDVKYRDRSKELILDTIQFAKKYTDRKIIVRRFVSGGVENLNLNKPRFEVYDRNGLPYPKACDEYSRADVFIVTHAESMGLSVLESALAGALVVSPNGYIRKSLISPLHHIEIDNKIPWNKVLNSLDIKRSVRLANRYTWKNVAKTIAEDLYGK